MPSPQMNAILREMEGHQRIFELDRFQLGMRMVRIAADAIRNYMDSEIDDTGAAWHPLAARYAAWKARHYPGRQMAVLDRIMKTRAQLIGTVVVQQHQVAQLYGTTMDAQLHSVWFQEGRPDQPPRPFYALNPLAISELDAFLDAWFVTHIP